MLLSKLTSALRSRWKHCFFFAALCGVVLRFQTFVLVKSFESSFIDTAASTSEDDEHTIPTLLSVVDDRTGKYIYALENALYNNLKNAQIVAKNEQTKDALEMPTIYFDHNTILPRDKLTLSWTLGKGREGKPIVSEEDVMLLYCGDQVLEQNIDPERFIEAATVAQARATSRKHLLDVTENYATQSDENSWYFPSFPVVRHDTCQVWLFQALPKDNKYALLAVSDMLHIQNGWSDPSGIHLALGNSSDTMVVQFKTGNGGTPMVRYGVKNDSLLLNASGTSHTYSADDMCQKPATEEEPGKFQPPGQLHVVTLAHLQPNTTYYYQVGLDDHGTNNSTWSPLVFSFVSAPEVKADSEPFSYVVYGDQGCPAKGWGDGAIWTADMTAREVDGLSNNLPIRAVHHMGDLSYARGAAHVWDNWLDMISSFTTRVPLMVAVGNHEYDHTKGGENGKDPSGVHTPGGYKPIWGNFGKDSDGECGVPTANLFSMPNSRNSNGVFWYSYDFANVHTAVVSSEHDFSSNSRQYRWLEADLKSVNRDKTPWLVLELHRSMYESEVDPLNSLVGLQTRHRIQGLLKQYQVDLVLSGHYHSYLRTCQGLYDGECDTTGGQTHITIGTAGANLRNGHLYPRNHWTESFIKGVYGYGRITVANASALHFEFVKAGNSTEKNAGEVLDETWILKDRGDGIEGNHHALDSLGADLEPATILPGVSTVLG